MKEMSEEETRNNIVRFTDSGTGKNLLGFGVDIGPGLPKNTRLVFFGFCRDSDSLKLDIHLLDESSPLAKIQKISFEDFMGRGKRAWDFMREGGRVPFEFEDFPERSVLEWVDLINKMINTLRDRFSEDVVYDIIFV